MIDPIMWTNSAINFGRQTGALPIWSLICSPSCSSTWLQSCKKRSYSKCLSYQGGLKYHQIMWLVPNKTVPHPTQRVPNTNRARWNSKSRCARQLKSFQDGTLGSLIWLWSWLLRNVQKLNWKKAEMDYRPSVTSAVDIHLGCFPSSTVERCNAEL